MDPIDDPRRRRILAVAGRAWPDTGTHHDRPLDRPVHPGLVPRLRAWSERASLIVNPNGDAVFDDHARRLAAASDDPLALQARLRQQYPLAVVRRRDLSGEPFEMWYVYRDGHWSPAES